MEIIITPNWKRFNNFLETLFYKRRARFESNRTLPAFIEDPVDLFGAQHHDQGKQ